MKEKFFLLIVIVIFAIFYYNREIHKSQIILELVEKKAKELCQIQANIENSKQNEKIKKYTVNEYRKYDKAIFVVGNPGFHCFFVFC